VLHGTTATWSPISIPCGTTVSPDVGVDSSCRAEASGPHAAGLVTDRLDGLLTGSAGPVTRDARSSELAAAVTEKIITEHTRRSSPEWAETKVHIAHDISRHLQGYSDPLPPQFAGAACSIATQRAGTHPDTLLNAIRACSPRIDKDRIDGEPVSGGRTI
jgi:hypothetical protein